MRRLADLSNRKADAMLARRRRREKGRVLRVWRCLHEKRKQRRRAAQKEQEEEQDAGEGRGREDITTSLASSGRSSSNESGSDNTSGSGSAFSSSGPSGSVRSSRSGEDGSSDGSRWSSFASSLSTKKPSDGSAEEASSASSGDPSRSFPVPSAVEAAEAGRANFAACFRAGTERMMQPKSLEDGSGSRGWETPVKSMASAEVAADAVHKAMRASGSFGGKGVCGGRGGFISPEMRALARFEWQRKTHEAKITRVVYGS